MYKSAFEAKIKNLKRERKFNVVIFDDYMDHGKDLMLLDVY